MKREHPNSNNSNNSNNSGSESGSSSPNKRARNEEELIRLLIPSKIAGAIIGKGGQNIQKLRSEYKATVSVDDCQGPERTVIISSDLDSVCNIVREILNNFDQKDGDIDLRMLIHQSLAGCVIGKAGSKIKELREKIGSRIKIFSNVAPQSTDRVVQILGNVEHCIESVKEIINLTKQTPIKGPVHNYDPQNFDDMYADEYGGFGVGGNGGRIQNGFRNGSRGFDRHDNNSSGGRYNDRRNNSSERNRSVGRQSMKNREYTHPWAHPPQMQNGPLSVSNMNYGSGGSTMNNGNMNSNLVSLTNMGPNLNFSEMVNNNVPENKTTTQVTIPKDLAGAIIGKGGGRIRRIRNESCATITIDEPLPGSNDRIITICGLPKQIQAAQFLLQQSVHENRRKF